LGSKNIRDHVRENQKSRFQGFTGQILRRFHIDLFITESKREKKKRINFLNGNEKDGVENYWIWAAEKMKVSSEDAYEKIGTILEEHVGKHIYRALRELRKEGNRNC